MMTIEHDSQIRTDLKLLPIPLLLLKFEFSCKHSVLHPLVSVEILIRTGIYLSYIQPAGNFMKLLTQSLTRNRKSHSKSLSIKLVPRHTRVNYFATLTAVKA